MALGMLSNPFVLVGFLAVAIGITVYQILEREKRRQPVRASGGPRSPPSPPPPQNKRVKENTNTIRNRKSGISEANKEEKASPNTKSFPGDNNMVSDKFPNSDYHTKIYDENECDGIKNQSENFNKNFEHEREVFEKNTTDDTISSQNDLNVQSVETKLLNTPDQQYDEESNQNVKGSPFNFVESDYKEAVLEKIKNDVIKEQQLCKACEKEIADAVYKPCGHCYMCSTCAVSLFRIYGKCTVCQVEIQSCEPRENTLA